MRRRRIETFEALLGALRAPPRLRATLLVAVDGHGGSGKTTFAAALQASGHDISVIRTDDFGHVGYPNSEWSRLARQVLHPLWVDAPGHYQRHDWTLDQLAEWHLVPTGGIIIVEGVGSLRTELRHYYDFGIWVECSREVCLRRAVERDGEAVRERWERWLTIEDQYIREHRPAACADLIVDGRGHLGHAAGREGSAAAGHQRPK